MDNQVMPPAPVTYVAPPIGFGSKAIQIKYIPSEFKFEIIDRGVDISLGVF